MIRTQIQLKESQARALKRLAAEEHRSVADLIRESVDTLLRTRGRLDLETLRDRASDVCGRYRSGAGDVADDHDRYLDEAYGA